MSPTLLLLALHIHIWKLPVQPGLARGHLSSDTKRGGGHAFHFPLHDTSCWTSGLNLRPYSNKPSSLKVRLLAIWTEMYFVQLGRLDWGKHKQNGWGKSSEQLGIPSRNNEYSQELLQQSDPKLLIYRALELLPVVSSCSWDKSQLIYQLTAVGKLFWSSKAGNMHEMLPLKYEFACINLSFIS